MHLKPVLLALLLAAAGCGRTTRGDDRPDGEPPYSGYPRVVVGSGRSCLLDSAGRLACWGQQLSSDEPPPRAFALVDFESSWCGLERDGTLSCWPTAEMNHVGAFPPAATARFRPGG